MAIEYKIAVRPLVEYVFRSGSIQSGFKSVTTLMEGAKAHRNMQKSYNEDDESEVFLQTKISVDQIDFHIEGRCDGILKKDEGIIIDEIKSTSGSLEAIAENSYPVHWAQAKCYAYMYAAQEEINSIFVQLSYIQKETEEIKRFKKIFTFQQLEKFIHDLLQSYAPFAKWKQLHQDQLRQSAKSLPFPYERYRKGQRQFAASVYQTMLDEKTLFATAPTGIGKTISTLFPSVKAMGEGKMKKLFYITARTTTRQTAEDAFDMMKQAGLILHSVTLTAKDKICFTADQICTKEHCPFADGYYDRINGAVLDILSHETMMTRKVIEEYAKKHRVCPFEFSLELAYEADAVICDYNYIFDPRVSLKRMLEETKRETILLVDEAHNLVDRAREMYSASLQKKVFLELSRQYKQKNIAIFTAAKAINDFFLQIRKNSEGEKFAIFDGEMEDIHSLVESFIIMAEKELMKGIAGEEESLLMDRYFEALSWLRIAKLYDDHFITYVEIYKSDVEVKMFCIDPSSLIQQAGKSFKARIFFSATLSPLDYFKDILGGEADDYELASPSPFAKEQTKVSIQAISTRYRDREKSLVPIISTIKQMIKMYPGNYLIFFPAYQYMNDVIANGHILADEEIETIVQRPRMTEEEREEFLQAFRPDQSISLAGFAVLGGVFSEGIDLIGNRLNGVIIVGVGLPQINQERNLIRDYYASLGKSGYDHAYVFPGMNKVLQAGGRLIRSETDSGMIVLIDDRYLTQKYQAMLPLEWKDEQILM